ncbi:Sterol uptake control protein 2 [Madurella fahalii]|uniref:Sterol uptake control protein 2 n=1 Tax=Madurella fahalii TaxID=1157608 RepID=A0ABQ0GDG5_9PEZI
MMRRSHKKSRRGCLECKRRHIKCDETRPQCINCTTGERDCQYSIPWNEPRKPPSDYSTGSQISSPGSTSNPTPAAFPEVHHPPVDEPHLAVDMVHMELLYHYVSDDGGIYPLLDDCLKHIIMATALREPYVMHSVLALSAHHLSVIRPGQQPFYHNLAIQLQTRALSLFNSIDVSFFGDSIEKRIPVFIFSCLLGFHALCDFLSHRDGDFDSAIARYQAYLRLHRGMHTVMAGHWDGLRDTELRVIFDELWPRRFRMKLEGQECDDIRRRIESSSLDPNELATTQKAIDLVQAVLEARHSLKRRAYILGSWAALISEPFVGMLERGRPEALAVLAYYFLALHYCRDVWMVGGAGQFLLTLLVDHFRGGEWEAWVGPPYRMLKDSLENEAFGGQFPAACR